jgi:hypothetical protein
MCRVRWSAALRPPNPMLSSPRPTAVRLMVVVRAWGTASARSPQEDGPRFESSWVEHDVRPAELRGSISGGPSLGGESPFRRTVMASCLAFRCESPMLVTIQVALLRFRRSPTTKIRSVNQYWTSASGKKIVSVRGDMAPAFRPVRRDGH